MLKNHQQHYHIFFGFYIYQGYIPSKNDLQKQLCQTFLDFYTNKEHNQVQKYVLTILTHIFLVIKRLGTTFIVEGQVSTAL